MRHTTTRGKQYVLEVAFPDRLVSYTCASAAAQMKSQLLNEPALTDTKLLCLFQQQLFRQGAKLCVCVHFPAKGNESAPSPVEFLCTAGGCASGVATFTLAFAEVPAYVTMDAVLREHPCEV